MSYLNEEERKELQARLSSTDISLHDLRMAFYGGQVGRSLLTENDNIRAYLQSKTGLTVDSLRDLWRAYLISQGIADQSSLEDMMKVFFAGDDLDPITNTQGTIIGFPFGYTYAS